MSLTCHTQETTEMQKNEIIKNILVLSMGLVYDAVIIIVTISLMMQVLKGGVTLRLMPKVVTITFMSMFSYPKMLKNEDLVKTFFIGVFGFFTLWMVFMELCPVLCYMAGQLQLLR